MSSALKKYALLALPICLGVLVAVGFSHSKESKGRTLAPLVIEEKYDFVNYDQNRIQFYGASDKWNQLFSKLDSVVFFGEGDINMIHIGGSHVQGGFLTDRIRERFSELTTGSIADRGFFFPYKMAGSNMAGTIECTWTGKWRGERCSLSNDSTSWGMAGVEAITNDSLTTLTISCRNADSLYYTFDKMRIYFRSSSNMMIESDESVRLLHSEYNAEGGYVEMTFVPKVTSYQVRFRRIDNESSEFALQGVHISNGNPGVVYSTIGVNGASTRSYLRCPNFGSQLYSLSPDLVIMAIGVNDANVPENQFDAALYEARYDSLVNKFLVANPNACFLFITNNDTFYQQRHPNRNALQVREVMQKLASKYNGAVYDWLEIMGGLGSMRTWRDNGLAAKDLVHFSKRGYEMEGDLFYMAFRDAFGDYLQRRK
jgi:lysophospholipase L1-like esterase